MNAAPPDRRAIITEALRKIDDLSARLEIAEKGDTEPIAVVGMGCRFPGGVNSPAQYWKLLKDGASGIVRVPAERWDADAYYSADHTVPGTICTRDGGFLTSWQPDEFDAEFFGISPREAAGIDPQQRLLLEVAWEALENAGITAQSIRGTQTSVFIGSTTNDYALTFAGKLRPQDIDPYIPFGYALNFAAGRLAYFLGVHGPAVAIDTACSSSLVAVHLACQSLRRRESDHALAAGVNLILSPENSIACSRWGMLAPDGRCKTFDAGADGYVRGEGCGVVVLKRLGDALRDGDSVLAVVRGTAVNQDGPSSGQTVPSGPAQQAVMRAALAAARLQPTDIDYVEAHGTGTALGDPIELDALGQVFAERDGATPLVLGSVKTNLGHLESAAGIAGFIKTVLSVQHGYIPQHLNFNQLTPHASDGASRFTIAAQGMAWPAVRRACRAGVSSFGVSGTNAHVVVEQAPAAEPVARQPEPVVSTLVISGKTTARIASTAAVLAEWMAGEGAGVPLADVAHTVNHHRTRHKTVAMVCARDREQAVTGLQALAAGHTAVGVVDPHEGPPGRGTVFVYSGQGSHWAGMGRRLLADEPAFAAAVDELEPIFIEHVGFSLRQVLTNGEQVSGDAQVQPVVMGLQLALTELWRSYGVKPDAVIGHSMGEVTAAVVAGALTPAEGLRVIAARSRLMSRLAGQGAVALLELDAEATAALVADYPEVSLAGYVSPRQTVVAGPVAPVEAVIAAVTAQDRFARRVNMEVASHTALMDPILPELRSALADLNPELPTVPFFSTVVEASTPPLLDAEYWVNNVRQPARLSQAVTAAAREHATFVEISAHPILTHAITETLDSTHHHSIGTLWRDGDDTIGFHISLNTIHTSQPPRTPHPQEPHPVLPTTPWHHTRHWITTENRVEVAAAIPRDDPGTLAHAIEWQPWDEYADAGVGSQQALAENRAPCTVAVIGADHAARTLRDRLAAAGYLPADAAEARCVLYVAEPGPVEAAETDIDCAVRLSAEVADLVGRLSARDDDHPATLWIITRGVREGISDAAVRQSCLWGIAGVIRAEQPQLWGGLVDIEAGPDVYEDLADCVSALSAVLQTPAKSVLALRDGEFLAPALVPVTGQPVREPFRCRADAAYLITGGLGALGLLMAGWLADRGARRLVLAGRTPLPPRRDWDSDANDADVRHKIAAIRALEMRGVSVDAVALDIGSRDALLCLLAGRDNEGAPPIRGVIHAAGVTEGQLLTEISNDRLRRTMWPKIAGAQVLHEAFPPGSLDFLFLTASAGTVFGVPGQGAYASANAYLDGLARARHRQGCHTVSLDWVAWHGLGFATDAQVVLQELERLGSRPVTPEEAFPAWEYVDTYDIAQAVMAPMPSDQPEAGVDRVSAPVRAWSEMAVDDLRRELEAGLRTILAREILLPEAELDVDRPFAELGLNSVMAMSIRRQAEKLVGIELSATMLWNHPTITSLAEHLAGKISPQQDSEGDDYVLTDSSSSVLDGLFDSIEETSASVESGIR